MFTYLPPASIDDLAGRPTRTAFLAAWHQAMKTDFETEIARLPQGNKLLFAETTTAATSDDLPVTWNAFPLSIRREHPDDVRKRWDVADVLRGFDRSNTPGKKVVMPFRVQDEYCEWHTYRVTPGGPIKRIVFTAEAPEYWIELAKHDFDRVVELYRQWVSPDVKPEDLQLQDDIVFGDQVLTAGTYNPYNLWNTRNGVVHLTHPANTLGAEINLAARATIPRRDAQGNRITDVRRFACSSDFGDPNRSSDPNIGSGVNLTAVPAVPGVSPKSITLANPVALYIDRLAPGVITDEQDNPLTGWFKIVRGVTGRGLMAVLEPPAGALFGLDKVRVAGDPLTHGGQVAEQIQMVLYAKTADLHYPAPPLQRPVGHCCRQDDSKPVDKVNLSHSDFGKPCAGASPKEAFPELGGASAAGDAGMDAGPLPQREPLAKRSRLTAPMSLPFND